MLKLPKSFISTTFCSSFILQFFSSVPCLILSLNVFWKKKLNLMIQFIHCFKSSCPLCVLCKTFFLHSKITKTFSCIFFRIFTPQALCSGLKSVPSYGWWAESGGPFCHHYMLDTKLFDYLGTSVKVWTPGSCSPLHWFRLQYSQQNSNVMRNLRSHHLNPLTFLFF